MADLRQLPKVDALAKSDALAGFHEAVRIEAARRAIGAAREAAQSGDGLSLEAIETDATRIAHDLSSTSVKRVINASGVILHTGLGRARLSPAAAKAVADVAAGHAAVELDLASGLRGDRQAHVRDLLTTLTGAADAFVVNNCAAAVFLSLSALCAGKGVKLSRGQMVEIGGSFRMPDIVRQSGCLLQEVGCTNKTRLSDYAEDSEQTGAILRCHPSNFRTIGFVAQPSLEELAELANRNGWWLIDDLGSGALFDTTAFGLPPEPRVQDSVRAGAHVSLFSADKLLGGPQAGIIVGSKEAVGKIRSHPLARAVRVDKLTISALEATLRILVLGREDELPTIRYMRRPMMEIKAIASKWARAYPGVARVEEGVTEIGGGSAPGTGLPTWRVGLMSPGADALAKRLRTGRPAILGRIEKDVVWLDPRTVDADEASFVVQRLKELG